jgi:hypothetical protein
MMKHPFPLRQGFSGLISSGFDHPKALRKKGGVAANLWMLPFFEEGDYN